MKERRIYALILTTLLVLSDADNSCIVRMQRGKVTKYGDCQDENTNVLHQEIQRKAVTEQETETTGCKSSVFEFREKESLGYVQYKDTLPEMTAFTTCAWVTPHQGETIKGALMSYCTVDVVYCNAIYVYFYPTYVEISLNNVRTKWDINNPITARSLVCALLSPMTRTVHYYVNGTEAGTALASTLVILSDGVLIVGQDQDEAIQGTTAGAPHQADDAFFGTVDGFAFWNRALSEAEMTEIHQSGCTCAKDALVVLDSTNTIVKSHVTASWDRDCSYVRQ